MSWFTDVVQDYVNQQMLVDQLKAALAKLEATHKECSREKE